MAERERKSQDREADVGQKRRKRQQESQPSFDKYPERDTGPFSLIETPFIPRMAEHAEVLSKIPLATQRHNFIMQLNNTYGYRYVQRLLDSIVVQQEGNSGALMQSRELHKLNVNDPHIQRLIVGAQDTNLETEFKKDKGWIAASTMAVALQRGGQDQDVIEFDELRGYQKAIGVNENIYFVGHGSEKKWGDKDPVDVARETGLKLPVGYKGSITSLSCKSGQKTRSGGASALDLFTGNLNFADAIMVYGAAGCTLHHPSIPNGVRTIKPQHLNKVADQIRATQDPVFDAWKTERDRVLAAPEYQGASYAEKVKILANASVELSKSFYLDLVAWADDPSRRYLYPAGGSYVAEPSKVPAPPPAMAPPPLPAPAPPRKKGFFGFCYITTACVVARNLPDDCYELTTLRAFRDGYMRNIRNGSKLIEDYYITAPQILARIYERPYAKEVLVKLFARIKQSVAFIEKGQNEAALQNYYDMVNGLKQDYI
jgi:hypothetical protein